MVDVKVRDENAMDSEAGSEAMTATAPAGVGRRVLPADGAVHGEGRRGDDQWPAGTGCQGHHGELGEGSTSSAFSSTCFPK